MQLRGEGNEIGINAVAEMADGSTQVELDDFYMGSDSNAPMKHNAMSSQVNSANSTSYGHGQFPRGMGPNSASMLPQDEVGFNNFMNTIPQPLLKDKDSISLGNKYHLQGGATIQQNTNMLIDEQNMRHLNNNRPTTGIPMQQYHHMHMSTLTPTGSMPPHALFNHQQQAASKKSFRIRGEQEMEMLKLQQVTAMKNSEHGEVYNGKLALGTDPAYRHLEIGIQAEAVPCRLRQQASQLATVQWQENHPVCCR